VANDNSGYELNSTAGKRDDQGFADEARSGDDNRRGWVIRQVFILLRQYQTVIYHGLHFPSIRSTSSPPSLCYNNASSNTPIKEHHRPHIRICMILTGPEGEKGEKW
jgi:hypothetical protein